MTRLKATSQLVSCRAHFRMKTRTLNELFSTSTVVRATEKSVWNVIRCCVVLNYLPL